MSDANVESIKLLTAAFNRRDLDAFSELATADVEWLPVFAARVEGDAFQGRAGIEAFLAEVAETWEEFRPVPEAYEDLGDRVLAIGRLETRVAGAACRCSRLGEASSTSARGRYAAFGPSSITRRRPESRAPARERAGPQTGGSVGSFFSR
jgi:ketosteroid isomerase-like protein